MAVPATKVVVGQQDLGDVKTMFTEKRIVSGHEFALANGGTSLELFELLGTLFQAKDSHAGSDGAGGDEDDLFFLSAERGELLDKRFDLRGGKPAAVARQDAGTDFDDDAMDFVESLLAQLHRRVT